MTYRDPSDSGLRRLKWMAVVFPLLGILMAELVRVIVFEQLADQDLAHLLWILGLGLAVVTFGFLMIVLIGRTQERIVSQNRDLSAIHASRSTVRAGADLGDTLLMSLERLLHETDALAGTARIEGHGLPALSVQHPPNLPSGLAWLVPLLDARSTIPVTPHLTEHQALDATVLDVPLVGGGAPLGVMRLAFHPAVTPVVSNEALADIGSEVGTSIYITHLLADLQRRERERDALYRVALHLTSRAELADVLDEVTQHACTLLAADSAVVRLTDPGGRGRSTDRLRACAEIT
ncbi:MAG: hypothetical protein ACC726_05270 [Chloroflexota bacterium]